MTREKQCARCGDVQPLSSFSSRVDGFGHPQTNPWCLACIGEHLPPLEGEARRTWNGIG